MGTPTTVGLQLLAEVSWQVSFLQDLISSPCCAVDVARDRIAAKLGPLAHLRNQRVGLTHCPSSCGPSVREKSRPGVKVGAFTRTGSGDEPGSDGRHTCQSPPVVCVRRAREAALDLEFL